MATSRRHTARPDATKPREIGVTVSDAMCTAFETVARVGFFKQISSPKFRPKGHNPNGSR